MAFDSEKKSEILKSLESNLPVEDKQEISKVDDLKLPSTQSVVDDGEDDYNFARENIKKLIGTSDDAINLMHELASEAEHPRAFEVLATMIKNASDMNNQLLDLTQKRKKLLKDDENKSNKSNSNTTNNVIFSGTTTDLQKLLSKEDDAIDVD